MADRRTKRIATCKAGTSIMGTVRDGDHRRFAETKVLDQWSSIKPAFRIELEDGTELPPVRITDF